MLSLFDNKYSSYTFHFMGIGGVSMSGLASILYQNGYRIQGSDTVIGDNLKPLLAKGIKIFNEQKKENITDELVIIKSLSIKDDNPELVAAKERNLQIIERHELLGEIIKHYKNSIAITGTHGKTSTSSMIGYILRSASLDPTLNIGADLFYQKNGTYFSNSDYMVLEACEYGNSFHSFKTFCAGILNIEADHLDFFKDLDEIKESFLKFASQITGFLTYYSDDKNCSTVASKVDIPVYSFGFKENDNYQARNIVTDKNGLCYDLFIDGNYYDKVSLSILGNHNIINSLCAISITHKLGVDFKYIKDALYNFKGAKRRLEKIANIDDICLYDDYAHHPTEIRASIKALRSLNRNRLIVVYQPHTYTRTLALLEEFSKCFADVDLLILADIYAAREKNIYNISSKTLADRIHSCPVQCISSFEEIANTLIKESKQGDLIVSMGAGDIFKVIYKLKEDL